MLVLELFGTLALRSDDGLMPPEARQKRRLGLLAMLALAGERGMSRHRVEAFLWPESNASRARHALDQAIYAVRRTLGAETIVATGQELSLNPECLVTDVWQFDEAIREGDWARAIGCYKGDLLDGCRFGESHDLEAWLDMERARRLHQYRNALASSADRAEAAGDVPQHVALRRDHAAADPLSARVATKLIDTLAAAGDRAGAVECAREYQELVRRELGIEADAAVEHLISELRRDSEADAQLPDGHASVSRNGAATARDQPPPADARADTPATRRAIAWIAVTMVPAIVGLTLLGRAMINRRLTGGDGDRSSSRLPLPAAREAYLRGVSAWEDRTKTGNDSAVVYFRKATELDPAYAAAYAQLAEAYVRLGYFGYRPAQAMFPKARAAAMRSLQLDSAAAAARTALGTEMIWEHDFRGAESQYVSAIALEPANATAHQWYGVLLMILGRTRDAVEQEHTAAELEPLSLQIQNNYATFLNIGGDRRAALRQFQKTVADEPDSAWVSRNPWLLQNMARVYADDGDFAPASHFIDQAISIVPRSPRMLHARAVIFDEMGRPDLAWQSFANADTSNEQYAAYRGMVYADQGRADSAFLWFAREVTWGIQPMLSLQSDPRLAGFRRDRRYGELMARLGLSAAPPE